MWRRQRITENKKEQEKITPKRPLWIQTSFYCTADRCPVPSLFHVVKENNTSAQNADVDQLGNLKGLLDMHKGNHPGRRGSPHYATTTSLCVSLYSGSSGMWLVIPKETRSLLLCLRLAHYLLCLPLGLWRRPADCLSTALWGRLGLLCRYYMYLHLWMCVHDCTCGPRSGAWTIQYAVTQKTALYCKPAYPLGL